MVKLFPVVSVDLSMVQEQKESGNIAHSYRLFTQMREMLALASASQWVEKSEVREVVLWSDSCSVLMSLQSSISLKMSETMEIVLNKAEEKCLKKKIMRD